MVQGDSLEMHIVIEKITKNKATAKCATGKSSCKKHTHTPHQKNERYRLPKKYLTEMYFS